MVGDGQANHGFLEPVLFDNNDIFQHIYIYTVYIYRCISKN